ncbi:hypothetical protein COU75_04575 [Candidatus Peregrinibacteria bacterium CG10_big_fil_rev_8_21_14_0_10_42_8]|nr:MAG: hypothetical protein COU75_04575 [Candidatus Peregrinibacteria bacterium CG10_big_fil_rev_8_21_14_0_10_42_8]
MTIRHSSIASVLTIVAIAGSAAVAQLVSSEEEQLQTTIGSVFEIQSVGQTGQTSWVLTQNGEFVEANRDSVFRTRFSQPGTFLLAAETEKNGETIRRDFRISALDRKPGDQQNISDGTSIAKFHPTLQSGIVQLSKSLQVLTITPKRKDIKVIAIDTDIQADSNNDGNPQNDDDTKNTLFRSEGTPLHLWIMNGDTRAMRMGVLFLDNTTQFESISITNGTSSLPDSDKYNNPNTIGEAPDGIKIQVLKSDNGEVQFGLQMNSEEKRSTLLLWNFGDGQQSMLDKPIHIFAESGTYDISVEVRDLATGIVNNTIKDTIVVNRMMEETENQPGTTEPSQPKEKKGDSGSIFGLIFKLIITLIISGAVGAGVLFIVGKVKKKGFSLEKSLQKAEEAIVKTPKETVAESAPPMEIREEAEVVPQAPAPEPEPMVMPDWLAQQEHTPVAEPQTETPTPEPVVETALPVETAPEEPAPHVKHDAMEPSTDQLKTDTTQAPDWLQSGIEKAEEVGQDVDTPPPEELQVPNPVGQNTVVDTEKEERLREKKRLKRQRYRENLKNRKDQPAAENVQENTSESPANTPESEDIEPKDMDETVAFIKAEDIEPMDPEEKQGS